LDQTWTKYPIVLVPGVFSWDNILGADINYFYQVEEAIEISSFSMNFFKQPLHQETHFIPLNPWQNTFDRAADLKQKLDALMAKHNYKKVNLIAHSHGSTTSRLAVRWMAQEAASQNRPTPIASLTTIAGPHFGTPVADYYMANENEALATLLNLSGNFMSLISFGPTDTGTGMFEYVGVDTQDSAAVFKDFSQEEITKFNELYPSAGLPEGAGLYGEGAVTTDGAHAGNGLGEAMNPDDPEAILYYSWTGNVGNGWNTAPDLSDAVMAITNNMNKEMGYNGDADGFIPVTSSHFGKVICDDYYWNHIDEINNLLGIVSPDAANPLTVYRLHAQRLQQAGR
jgi:triacylglycerol lipase